jgi:hypothetical protein
MALVPRRSIHHRALSRKTFSNLSLSLNGVFHCLDDTLAKLSSGYGSNRGLVAFFQAVGEDLGRSHQGIFSLTRSPNL